MNLSSAALLASDIETRCSISGTIRAVLQLTDALLIFAKVGEVGSISGAARALGLPKANVSRAVSRLESDYGVALVDRTRQRPVPTEIGRKLLVRCAAIQDQLDAAEAEIAAYYGIPSGTLRVGCPAAISAQLARWLPEFLDCYPKVDLRLKVADRVLPEPHGVDLVLHAGWLSDSSLIASRIAELGMILVASPAYLEAYGTPTTPEDLVGHRVIGNYYVDGDPGHADPHEVPAHVPTLEIVRRGVRSVVPVWWRFVSNDLLLILDLVRCGMAIAPISRILVEQELGSGALRRILPEYEIVDSPALYVVYSGRSADAPKVRAFINFIATKVHARIY